MSWTMWHVNGTGFDIAKAEPEKYRDFILAHKESLGKAMSEDTVKNLIYYLTERPEELEEPKIDLDDIRDLMSIWTAAEPIACIMAEETGLSYDFPGCTGEGEDCVLFTAKEPWYMTDREKSLKSFEELFSIMKPYADELGVRLEGDLDLVYA